MKPLSFSYRFELFASDLLDMKKGCSSKNSSVMPTQQFLRKPNLVGLPICRFYPVNPHKYSSHYCCKEYSEVHKNLHKTMNALHNYFEKTGLSKMYERIALTMSDYRASDLVASRCLNAKIIIYSNAAGEFMLSKSFIKDVFSLKESKEMTEYSESQPVSRYFLQLINEYSACQPCLRLQLEEIPGCDTIFMVRTDIEASCAYLPLLYCLGMLIGCPYAGSVTSKIWVFKKEMLYLFAKVFGIMDMNIFGLLFDVMKTDILCHSQQQVIFCKPLWRVLMAVERNVKEPECISHIPRTSMTLIELSRFADIVKRSIQLELYEKSEIKAEQARILNTYHTAQKDPPEDDVIKAVLMFENCLLRESVPQFIPCLKWIHKRLCLAEFVDEEHTLEEKRF